MTSFPTLAGCVEGAVHDHVADIRDAGSRTFALQCRAAVSVGNTKSPDLAFPLVTVLRENGRAGHIVFRVHRFPSRLFLLYQPAFPIVAIIVSMVAEDGIVGYVPSPICM